MGTELTTDLVGKVSDDREEKTGWLKYKKMNVKEMPMKIVVLEIPKSNASGGKTFSWWLESEEWQRLYQLRETIDSYMYEEITCLNWKGEMIGSGDNLPPSLLKKVMDEIKFIQKRSCNGCKFEHPSQDQHIDGVGCMAPTSEAVEFYIGEALTAVGLKELNSDRIKTLLLDGESI